MPSARLSPVFFVLPMVLLAACAPPPEPPVQEPVAFAETCNAEAYAYLKGQPIDSVGMLTTTLKTRVLAADSFVPRDFDPNRLTFTTSPEGTVSRIFCG